MHRSMFEALMIEAQRMGLYGPFDQIDAFPKHLIRLYLGQPKLAYELENEFNRVLRKSYRGGLRRWLKIVAPRGWLWAGRGLHDVKSITELRDLVVHYEYPKRPVSFSLNLFQSSRLFTSKGKTEKNAMGVLIVAKLRLKDIKGFGGDSESGPLHEAEIEVKPCEPCVHAVFVLSKKKIGRLATLSERKKFGLSYYYVTYEFRAPKHMEDYGQYQFPPMTFPVSAKSDIAKLPWLKKRVKLITSPQATDRPFRSNHAAPPGYKWYRAI